MEIIDHKTKTENNLRELAEKLEVTRLLQQASLFIWLFILAMLIVVSLNVDFTNQALASIALILFLLGIVTLTLCFPAGFWSPVTLFFVVMGLFHLGLTPFWIFDIDPLLTLHDDYVWYLGDAGGTALLLVTWGCSAFIVGALVVLNLLEHRKIETQPLYRKYSSDVEFPYFKSIGPLLLILSLSAWALVAISAGGVFIFFSSYRNFLNATAGAPLGYVYLFIGLSLGLTFIYPVTSILGKFSIALFSIFAVVAFFMGLRGEVLFPIMVGASVLAMRRRMPNPFMTTIFFIATLTLINLAKEVRNLGVNATDFSWYNASPLSALSELGSSIRVVATVANWHEGLREPFMNGTTYTVSIARFLESMFGPASRLPATDDHRLMNIEIAERAGNIGGSIIAESYHNFSFWGTLIVLATFGAMFAFFSIRLGSASSIAIYVVFAVPLFNHIRNSFVPVIPYIIIGLILILGIMMLQKNVTSTPSELNRTNNLRSKVT